MESISEHELSRRARLNESSEEPKRVKERAESDDSICKKSTADGSDPTRLIPNTDINESKRAKFLSDMADPRCRK